MRRLGDDQYELNWTEITVAIAEYVQRRYYPKQAFECGVSIEAGEGSGGKDIRAIVTIEELKGVTGLSLEEIKER